MPLSTKNLFSYRGKNRQGQYIEGRLKAENSQWARHKLRKKALKYNRLKNVGTFLLGGINRLNLLIYQNSHDN